MRDKYGRPEVSAFFRNGDLDPYLVEADTSTGVTYVCYTNDARRVIRRITETVSGTTTTTKIEAAFGAWAARASLTYQPVNQEFNE